MTPNAGSEVFRRAGSNVEESGSSEYLRTGVVWQKRFETKSKHLDFGTINHPMHMDDNTYGILYF